MAATSPVCTQHRSEFMTAETQPRLEGADLQDALRSYERFLVLRWGGVAFGVFAVVALVTTGLRGRPEVELDPLFGVPAIPGPNDVPFAAELQGVVLAVLLGVGLIGVVWGGVQSWRSDSWLPAMVALSVVGVVVPATAHDLLGAVYVPWSETEPFGDAFRMFGRNLPAWTIAGWFACGAFCLAGYRFLQRRPSTRMLWCGWFAAMGVDLLLVETLSVLGLQHFYGNQPLVLLHAVPWWWIPSHTLGLVLAVAIAHRAQAALHGWRAAVLLLVTPVAVAAAFAVVAVPAVVAANSTWPWLPTQLLGLVTIALSFAAFMGILAFVLRRDPLELDHTPVPETEFSAFR